MLGTRRKKGTNISVVKNKHEHSKQKKFGLTSKDVITTDTGMGFGDAGQNVLVLTIRKLTMNKGVC